MNTSGPDWLRLRLVALAVWVFAAAAIVWLGYRFVLAAPSDPGHESFPVLQSTGVVQGPAGHAYQYVTAPNITWDQARLAAGKLSFHGHPGYLATIDDEAEFNFVIRAVFSRGYSDVTYLGGRQTAPGEWRWVTGPDAAMDGGRGALFWRGNENGAAPDGRYANWMKSAFQHGGRWDVKKVCCVTLFSYGLPQFSTSLGDGFWEENVSGYLVKFDG